VGGQEEEARELVAAMVEANGLESLVLRLGNLDEGVAEEDAAVYNALSTLENMIELQPSVLGQGPHVTAMRVALSSCTAACWAQPVSELVHVCGQGFPYRDMQYPSKFFCGSDGIKMAAMSLCANGGCRQCVSSYLCTPLGIGGGRGGAAHRATALAPQAFEAARVRH